MISTRNTIAITTSLIDWYKINKRDLPWRNTNNPYYIWISEIILQQTRVNQGIGYYYRFIERFKTIEELAMASEDEVLKYWQGLGYYSRARNLHKAAKQIMTNHNAEFPKLHSEILCLSGIGEYTAAAICSFAYNMPIAAIDGNIFRVLSRIFANDTAIDSQRGRKVFSSLAEELLPQNEPGLFNQAIMEFGALQCTPGLPDCSACPITSQCTAYLSNTIGLFPVKSKKKESKNRYFNYLNIRINNTDTFLNKRVKKDIWQNLYEFPLIETSHLLTTEELIAHPQFTELFEGLDSVVITKVSSQKKHILSHQNVFAQLFTIEITETNEKLSSLTYVPQNQIDLYAVSRLTEILMESIEE